MGRGGSSFLQRLMQGAPCIIRGRAGNKLRSCFRVRAEKQDLVWGDAAGKDGRQGGAKQNYFNTKGP